MSVTLNLNDEEAWMVYDLVTAKKEARDECEIEIRGPAGGERWRLLHRKIRAALPVPASVPAGAPSDKGANDDVA